MPTPSTPGSLMLTGVIVPYAGNSPPAGWLECDGKAISRVKYASLFTVINTTFGPGDGSTTFHLPDLRGEFIRGWDNGRGIDQGRDLGTLQADQLQTHKHADKGHTHADAGHSHTDNGHSHADAGHTHSDNGHTHDDTGHSHPYYHVAKAGIAIDGSELTTWDGKGNYRADDLATAKANIQTSHANIQAANANIQTGHADIQTSHAAIQTGHADLTEPVDARHGEETRPRNIALMYIIKF